MAVEFRAVANSVGSSKRVRTPSLANALSLMPSQGVCYVDLDPQGVQHAVEARNVPRGPPHECEREL